MSYFSNSLSDALKHVGLSQADFAQNCGMAAAQLNKYVRGSLSAGPGNLQAIAKALPERERAQVVSAWLRDQIPAAAAGLVSVVSGVEFASGESSLRELAQRPCPLAPAVQLAIEHLTGEARKHREIGDLLVDMSRALKGVGTLTLALFAGMF